MNAAARRIFLLSVLGLSFGILACEPRPPDGPLEDRDPEQVREDTAFIRAQEEATDACAEKDPCIIVIRVDGEGRLSYRESESDEGARVARLWQDQAVRWELEDGEAWGVEFLRGRSPLAAPSFGSRQGLEPGGRAQVGRGLYKYFVAVMREGELYTDDPEFVMW